MTFINNMCMIILAFKFTFFKSEGLCRYLDITIMDSDLLIHSSDVLGMLISGKHNNCAVLKRNM